MTTARDTIIAAGIVLLWTALVAVGAFVACGLPVLVADWLLSTAIPAVQAWAAEYPNERDILTIGVLALVALLASELRK